MPVLASPLPTRGAARPLAVLALLASAAAANATDAAAGDPGFVVSRSVHPRIAYRALPAAANPVQTRATLFPARAFHAAIGQTADEVLGDEALGARGSVGLVTGSAAFAPRLDAVPAPAAVDWAAPRAGVGTSVMAGVPLGASIQRSTGAIGALGTLGAQTLIVPTLPGGGP